MLQHVPSFRETATNYIQSGRRDKLAKVKDSCELTSFPRKAHHVIRDCEQKFATKPNDGSQLLERRTYKIPIHYGAGLFKSNTGKRPLQGASRHI